MDVLALGAIEITVLDRPHAVVNADFLMELPVDDGWLAFDLHQQRVDVEVYRQHLSRDVASNRDEHLQFLQSLRPDVFVSLATVAFWRWLVFLLFCSLFGWLFSFDLLLGFFGLRGSLFLGLLLLSLFLFGLLLGLLLLLALLLLGLFLLLSGLLRLVDVEILFAGGGDGFLGFFLIGEEVGVSTEEAEYCVKEAVDVALLLNHAHEHAVELVVLFVRHTFDLKIQFQNFLNPHNFILLL